MRNINASALAAMAATQGARPYNLVGISWGNSALETLYSDKAISNIPGKVLEISGLDSVINLANSSSSQITVTLSDTDGSLKTLMDTIDIHKKPCTIYQYFESTSLSQKFVIFKGEVASPIIWSEGARTLTFSVLSKLEDKEIGFAPEQGKFSFVSDDLAGKPWPLVFGDCLHVPATKIKETARGVLKEPIGFVDPSLLAKRTRLQNRKSFLTAEQAYYTLLQGQADEIAPPAQQLLQAYLASIITEDDLRRQALRKLDALYKLDRRIKKATDQAVKAKLRIARRNKVADLNSLATQVQANQLTKADIAYKTQLDLYEAKVKQELFAKNDQVIQNLLDNEVLLSQVEDLINDQMTFQKDSFGVYHGDKFPQNEEIDLIISDIRIRGTMSGETFTVKAYGLAKYVSIAMAPRQSDRLDAFWITDASITLTGLYVWTNKGVIKVVDQIGSMCIFELKDASDTTDDPSSDTSPSGNLPRRTSITGASAAILANGEAAPLDNDEFNVITNLEALVTFESSFHYPQIKLPKAKYEFVGEDITALYQAAPLILEGWIDESNDKEVEALPSSGMYYAEAGTTVFLADDYEVTYACNILPSTIVAVSAYRVVDNVRRLVTVPSTYYTKNEAASLGSLTATTITLKKPLTDFAGEQWEEEVFVSMTSSVGPNTADIIQWMVETYSSLSVDPTSFAHVSGRLTNYPSHFFLLEQKNLITAIQEIAWQARCSVWVDQDIVYIRYLSEEPTSIETVDDSCIEHASLRIDLTPTEDLVTKLVATWKAHGAQADPNRTTLRHNVAKYGSLEKEFDFYIYNIYELVEKSATYWLIQYANSWKNVEFNVFLDKLKIEALDCITIDLNGNHIATGPVKTLVDKADYDSASNTISIRARTPVKAGTLVPYTLFWPADVAVDTEFPTEDEVFSGQAGSGAPNGNVTGNLTPAGDSSNSDRPLDFGGQFPSDASNTMPNSPLNGFLEIGQNLPFLRGIDVGPMVEPDPKAEVLEDDKVKNRQAFIGVILEELEETEDGQLQYKVSTDPEGGSVTVTQQQIPNGHYLTVGDSVVVVRNHLNDGYVMQAQVFFDYVAEFKVVSIEDDYYVCTRVDERVSGNIKVAKAPSHRKRSFDGLDIVTDHTCYWVNDRYRVYVHDDDDTGSLTADTVIKAIEFKTPVEVDDIITATQFLDAVIPVDPDAEQDDTEDGDEVDSIFWQHVTDETWQLKQVSEAELRSGETYSPSSKKVHLTGELDYKIEASETFIPEKYFYRSKNFCQFVLKTEWLINTWVTTVINYVHRAKTIKFQLVANLESSDSVCEPNVIDYNDGYSPGPTVHVYNTLGFRSDAGKLGLAWLRDDDTYEMVNVQCSDRDGGS